MKTTSKELLETRFAQFKADYFCIEGNKKLKLYSFAIICILAIIYLETGFISTNVNFALKCLPFIIPQLILLYVDKKYHMEKSKQ